MEALTTYLLIAAAFVFGFALLAKGLSGMKRTWRTGSQADGARTTREGN